MVVDGFSGSNKHSHGYMKLALLVGLLAAFIALTSPIHAQDYVELPPNLDARAARIENGIMCPVCKGETISQSSSQIAATMRQMVRERLLAGDTDQQIYAFMANAFGDDILASPPTSGIGLAVWIIPPVALLAGAIVITLFVRRLRRRNALAGAPQVTEANGDIDSYLRLVDQEIGKES